MDFKKTVEAFDTYVNSFDKNTFRLDVKYHHSFRVVKYAEQIALDENLNEHDFYLAQIIALFHDISRFRQGKEYGTFNDLKSFDHGDVASQILEENGFIDQFVETEEDRNIVLKAVKNHNKYQIEDGLTEKELFFAKLVRDADKIDILDTQLNEILDNSNSVNDDVYTFIKNKKLYKREKDVSRNDYSRICMQLTFVFDLYFKKSFEIIKEKNIIKKKLDVINNKEIENIINSFIEEKTRMF